MISTVAYHLTLRIRLEVSPTELSTAIKAENNANQQTERPAHQATFSTYSTSMTLQLMHIKLWQGEGQDQAAKH